MRDWFKNILTRHVGLVSFTAAVCVFTLAAFQAPLLSYALRFSDLHTVEGWVQILSLQVLQFCLFAALVGILATIALWLMKTVVAVLFIVNAVALYFMLTYGIEIDRTMVGNILNTDQRETAELLHVSLLPYVLFLGIIPAVLVLAIKVQAPKRIWRLALALGAIGVLAAWSIVTSFTMLWYDRHASRMGSKILPWSYVVNVARHFDRVAMDNREQVLLPDAYFVTAPSAPKDVVVLVIGEAARADRFSALGYARETNPFTARYDLAVFPAGLACSTNTISSTACILTHEGRHASARTVFEPLPNYLKRQGIATIFRSNNSGPPPIDVDLYQNRADILEACAAAPCPEGGSDALLNWQLGDLIEQAQSARVFVTLHQTGSHGPAYYSKYPKEFEYFTPVCDTVQVSRCSQEALDNAYDNTIRYTDSLIADLIAQLDALSDVNAALIYVSDHGQSLGENGFYLHGAPNAIAPKAQREVPFFVWMSEGFAQARNLTPQSILRQETHPHDFPFHSVMGAFGLRSEIYKPEFDIFNNYEQ